MMQSGRYHLVMSVFDGDTILLDDNRRIRLIGVEAPALQSPYGDKDHFGKESKKYLASLILNKKVSLTITDTQKDGFGSIPAFVYLGDVLVNGRVIRDGWARSSRIFHHTYGDLFTAYEREAHSRGLGMWKQQKKTDNDETYDRDRN